MGLQLVQMEWVFKLFACVGDVSTNSFFLGAICNAAKLGFSYFNTIELPYSCSTNSRTKKLTCKQTKMVTVTYYFLRCLKPYFTATSSSSLPNCSPRQILECKMKQCTMNFEFVLTLHLVTINSFHANALRWWTHQIRTSPLIFDPTTMIEFDPRWLDEVADTYLLHVFYLLFGVSREPT